MIAFPEMLIAPAEKAGMAVPPDSENFDREEYPHFAVFCAVQLGASMPTPVAHWDNTKVIAAVPEDKIRIITFKQLIANGLAVPPPFAMSWSSLNRSEF